MSSQKKYLAKVHEVLEGYMVLTSDSIMDANEKVGKTLYEKGFRSKKFIIEDRKTKVLDVQEINPHNTVEDLYRILDREFDSSSLEGYDAYKKHEEIKNLPREEDNPEAIHQELPNLSDNLQGQLNMGNFNESPVKDG